MVWTNYMKEEGWRYYGMEELVHLPIPEGRERDSFMRRIAECKTKEEMWKIVEEVKKLYGEEKVQ